MKVGNNQGNIFVRRMKPVHRCVERVKCALRCIDSGTCSLLNCFDMAPVFSLWISSSFGSSFVVEAARRDHELLSLSPKAKSLNTVWSLKEAGGFGILPSHKGLTVWIPSSTSVFTPCYRQRLYKGAWEHGETKQSDLPLPSSFLALHTTIAAHTANSQKQQWKITVSTLRSPSIRPQP